MSHRLLSLLLTLCLLCTAAGFSKEVVPQKLTDLRTSWESACERDVLPVKKSYLASLEKLRDELTRAENISQAIVVTGEIKKIEGNADAKEEEEKTPSGEGPGLVVLRKKYETQLATVIGNNHEIYRKALQSLKSSYAKAGDLDAAIAVTAEFARVSGVKPGAPVAGSRRPPAHRGLQPPTHRETTD